LALLLPVTERLELGSRIIGLATVAVLLSAVWDASGKGRSLLVASILALPSILSQLANVAFDVNTGVKVFAQASTAAFLAFVIWHIMLDIRSRDRVDADTLRGAICVYLLLALFWAVLYFIVFLIDPAAFDIPTGLSQVAVNNPFAVMSYFSLVTLTTLGYGDVTPLTSAARSLSTAEAVVGQLFVAIAIAQLVAMHIAHRKSS
jgi:hypothetical protein